MNKNITLQHLILIVIFCFLHRPGCGQAIFTNPITNANPSLFNPYTNGQLYEPNITVSGIGRSASLTASAAANRYSASNWSTSPAIDVTKYFEFTITPLPGFTINFLSFVYTGQVSTGTPGFAFRSGLDNYTMNIGTPSATGTTISLSGPLYQGITAAITFRLYVFNVAAGSTTFSINDFTFNRQPQYFQSAVIAGDWNNPATWISSLNNTTWSYQGLLPSANDKTITIRSGNTVMVTTPVSLDETTINGTLQLSGSGLLSINNGAGDDITIGTTGLLDAGSNASVSNAALGSFNITGTFKTAYPGGFTGAGALINTGTVILNTGSTIEYNASANQAISTRTDYYNITFSGSGTRTLSGFIAPKGTVYITGTAIVQTGPNNFGDGGTIPFTRLTMDGGRLIVNTTGTQPYMTGTYTLSGGVIEFASSQATAQTIRNRLYQDIEVTGNNVGNSSGNITLNTNGTFTVKTNGIFTINDNNITGTGGTQTVSVENEGTFRCGNNEGFNGFAATLTNNSSVNSAITHINLNPGSTVEYMRGGDQPITNANGLIYGNLRISGAGIKTAPSGILTVQGNLTKPGTGAFAHNNGTVLLNGTTQSFAGLTYNNLILTNGTKTTSGSSTIIDSIKINDGTMLSISAADTITLHSDSAKTARVGQIGTGTIAYNTTGKFLVERYIPAKKAWRFLAVPTNSTQTINQAWQEGAAANLDPNPGYGTQITGNQANWMANGFDALSYAPSVKTYDPGSDTYSGITSTTGSFKPGPGGYMTFIRGNRSATSIGSAVSSTTLRTSGALFTGDQPVINLIPGQFIPVNNPYASALDLRNISQSDSIFYYVWDPNLGGGYGYGAFHTLSWNGADYDVVPANSGSYGVINNTIAGGQAFFAAGNGPIQIKEGAKTATITAIIPFTPAGVKNRTLRTNLYRINADGSTTLADGVLNQFGDNYSNDADDLDARKLSNFGENLSVKSNHTLLAIERRSSPGRNDTIFLKLTGTSRRAYRLEIISTGPAQPGTDAFLEDNYLRSRYFVHGDDTTRFDFTINGDTASAAPDRFRIVFDAAGGALPVAFTNVKAYPKNNDIAVEWVVDNETGIQNYQVEQSPDGVHFTPAAIIIANNLPVRSSYSWLDKQPPAGYHYFRIAGTRINGKVQYSHIVKVFTGNHKREISVYPNPAGNGIIHLEFSKQPAGKYVIRLINTAGAVILSKEIQHAYNGSESIPIDAGMAHGVYRMEVAKPDGTVMDINVEY